MREWARWAVIARLDGPSYDSDSDLAFLFDQESDGGARGPTQISTRSKMAVALLRAVVVLAGIEILDL